MCFGWPCCCALDSILPRVCAGEYFWRCTLQAEVAVALSHFPIVVLQTTMCRTAVGLLAAFLRLPAHPRNSLCCLQSWRATRITCTPSGHPRFLLAFAQLARVWCVPDLVVCLQIPFNLDAALRHPISGDYLFFKGRYVSVLASIAHCCSILISCVVARGSTGQWIGVSFDTIACVILRANLCMCVSQPRTSCVRASL
jgi:hypothetical protein